MRRTADEMRLIADIAPESHNFLSPTCRAGWSRMHSLVGLLARLHDQHTLSAAGIWVYRMPQGALPEPERVWARVWLARMAPPV